MAQTCPKERAEEAEEKEIANHLTNCFANRLTNSVANGVANCFANGVIANHVTSPTLSPIEIILIEGCRDGLPVDRNHFDGRLSRWVAGWPNWESGWFCRYDNGSGFFKDSLSYLPGGTMMVSWRLTEMHSPLETCSSWSRCTKAFNKERHNHSRLVEKAESQVCYWWVQSIPRWSRNSFIWRHEKLKSSGKSLLDQVRSTDAKFTEMAKRCLCIHGYEQVFLHRPHSKQNRSDQQCW